MIRLSIETHRALAQGQKLTPYVGIQTHLAWRSYASRPLAGSFAGAALYADGSITADGSHTAGAESEGMADNKGRLLDPGSFERSIAPQTTDILTAMQSKQVQSTSITLDNTDLYFSKMIAKEPFLSRPLSIYAGLDSRPSSEHIPLFQGVINEIEVNSDGQMIITAEER
jgi:hypothetical protein